MNHLTQYYRNLSEQLQEQVNILEAKLIEARIHTPEEMRQLGMPAERIAKRQKLIDFLFAAQKGEHTHKTGGDEDAVERVLRDVVGVGERKGADVAEKEQKDMTKKRRAAYLQFKPTSHLLSKGSDSASISDLKKILAGYRRDEFAEKPEKEKLDDARWRSWRRYTEESE